MCIRIPLPRVSALTTRALVAAAVTILLPSSYLHLGWLLVPTVAVRRCMVLLL